MQIIRHKTQQDWIWAHCRHSFIPCLWPTLASGQITLCLWEHLFLVSSAWLPGPFRALEAARYYNDPFWFLGFWHKFLNLYLFTHTSLLPPGLANISSTLWFPLIEHVETSIQRPILRVFCDLQFLIVEVSQMLEVYFYSGFAISSQKLLHNDIKQNSTNVRLSSRGLADGSVKFSWQPSCLKLSLPEAVLW